MARQKAKRRTASQNGATDNGQAVSSGNGDGTKKKAVPKEVAAFLARTAIRSGGHSNVTKEVAKRKAAKKKEKRAAAG